MRTAMTAGIAAVAMAGLIAGPLQAEGQRDPAYAAARAAGQVGEKPDGFLGIVGNADPALQRLVNDINIKRKAIYAQKAQEQKTTPENYAFTSGCIAIAKTEEGERYMSPDGRWQTRTDAPPLRDPRCP